MLNVEPYLSHYTQVNIHIQTVISLHHLSISCHVNILGLNKILTLEYRNYVCTQYFRHTYNKNPDLSHQINSIPEKYLSYLQL